MEYKMLRKLIVAVSIMIFATSAVKAQDVKINSSLDSAAYAIGVQIGSNLLNDSLMVDVDVLKAGVYDALYEDNTQLTQQQIGKVMKNLQAKIQAKQKQAFEANAQESLKKSQEFLAENKKKAGVQTTGSGLQYEVLKEGTGKKPSPQDTVEVHYEGKLIDGTVFDSSYERGEPIEFQLDKVIKGWTEGVTLMKEGAKYMLYIPPDLGYGQRGAGQQIGPNEALIFEVELLDVKEAQSSGTPDSGMQK